MSSLYRDVRILARVCYSPHSTNGKVTIIALTISCGRPRPPSPPSLLFVPVHVLIIVPNPHRSHLDPRPTRTPTHALPFSPSAGRSPTTTTPWSSPNMIVPAALITRHRLSCALPLSRRRRETVIDRVRGGLIQRPRVPCRPR
jgi:hypothetical protein